MGILWKSAMPLLSTLAALVIIVHSAEEDLDPYELVPDGQFITRSPNYEQAWRIKEFENQDTQTEALDYHTPEEPPTRRRIGRKRKRPSTRFAEPAEFDIPQSRHSVESSAMREETNSDETEEITDGPRRRRKKLNLRPNRWIVESQNTERTIRRRLKNRKLQTPKTHSQLSEFGTAHKKDEPDIVVERVNRNGYLGRPHPNADFTWDQDDESEDIRPVVKEDRSLSEFSMEVIRPKSQSTNIEEPIPSNNKNIYEVDSSQDQGKIDPQTLMKEILKRSNGTSLSEILQLHNLTLPDLLNGNENAISLLTGEKLLNPEEWNFKKGSDNEVNHNSAVNVDVSDENEAKRTVDETNKDPLKQNLTTTISSLIEENDNDLINKNNNNPESNKNEIIVEALKNSTELNVRNINTTQTSPVEKTSRILANRRFPGGVRRKLRMRPMMNNTYKSQINRDLIALSARRYYNYNRKNTTKAKEWKGMIPLMINVNSTANLKEPEKNVLHTTVSVPTETEMLTEVLNPSTVYEEILTTVYDEVTVTDKPKNRNEETTTVKLEILATDIDIDVTDKPTTTPVSRPTVSVSSLRRQAYNNRLKKKRLKHKSSTTETPQNDVLKNILNMGDFVSSSEFIARTQLPKDFNLDIYGETATELEDFFTTETTRSYNELKPTEKSVKSSRKLSPVTKTPLKSTTEETAKIEIQEILNDTHTSAKLSKILRERNMTLNELLEHRERGSSNVHLADIFHNASREPNPPEPFLSKSLIEPISKETYPLRALLEANLHDPSGKVTTDISLLQSNHINVPIRMDFGNNVNENAENMGIMSLFNNFTKDSEIKDNSNLQKDSDGTPYKSAVISVNTTDDDSDMARESRMISDDQDMVSWNEIFAMIRKNNETKESETLTKETATSDSSKKISSLEEDVDGDGLIVLEDLQHLKHLDKKVAQGSGERIQYNSYEQIDVSNDQGILNKPPSSTKSVTVATASIVGLAMVLFLLTYAALKWKQQRSVSQKNNFSDERIPTPVFENRKIKKNCSSRSISPMLPQSNIYTMGTLESQNGKDSPEYMWDTLRKPFQ